MSGGGGRKSRGDAIDEGGEGKRTPQCGLNVTFRCFLSLWCAQPSVLGLDRLTLVYKQRYFRAGSAARTQVSTWDAPRSPAGGPGVCWRSCVTHVPMQMS